MKSEADKKILAAALLIIAASAAALILLEPPRETRGIPSVGVIQHPSLYGYGVDTQHLQSRGFIVNNGTATAYDMKVTCNAINNLNQTVAQQTRNLGDIKPNQTIEYQNLWPKNQNITQVDCTPTYEILVAE